MATDREVIDFGKAKKALLEERRRKNERVLFKHILGAYCVIEGEKQQALELKAVELIDISIDGLSFQLPQDSKNLKPLRSQRELTMRLYFSRDSYLPVALKVVHERNAIEDGKSFIRFGCQVEKKLKCYDAYKTFVEFLSKYIEFSKQDNGDLKVFFF